MRDDRDRESSGGTGVLIAAAAVVVVLLVCGGGALAAAGLLYFRMSAAPIAVPPPPAVPPVSSVPAPAEHVLAIDADGAFFWNDAPISSAELRERLDELKRSSVPPGSVIVRSDPAAPSASRDEVVQLLNDRQVSYVLQE